MIQPNNSESCGSQKVELVKYGIVTSKHVEADKDFASRHGRTHWSAVERQLSADFAHQEVIVPIVTHCNELKPDKHVSLTRRLSQQVDQPLEIAQCSVRQFQDKSIGNRLKQKLFRLPETTHIENEELSVKQTSFRQWILRKFSVKRHSY